MGSLINAVSGNEVRVGRVLRDARGREWTVTRLYPMRGEAMLFDPARKITRFFHPVHDRGEMAVAS